MPASPHVSGLAPGDFFQRTTGSIASVIPGVGTLSVRRRTRAGTEPGKQQEKKEKKGLGRRVIASMDIGW